MKIAFFGSSLLSSYWNGAATYYRGIIRALHSRGHQVVFYEPNIFGRQQHRDINPPSWAGSVVYANSAEGALKEVANVEADLIIKTSGIGAFDELLEEAVLEKKNSKTLVAFWDVDAPATLDRLRNNKNDPFRKLIPDYNAILTYGGGDLVTAAYKEYGARECLPIYHAHDPQTHFPVMVNAAFTAHLSFLANRLPDREGRADQFFLVAARHLKMSHFLLGGSGWEDKELPKNISYIGHVSTRQHNVFNCSAHAVLSVSRNSMARYGFSPATQIFEAAAASACIISDDWEGISNFFEPSEEILVAHNGEEVAALLSVLSPERARLIGSAARLRALAKHTYSNRAKQFDQFFNNNGL